MEANLVHYFNVNQGTEKTDGTEGDQKSAQDDDFEREAKMATKREREAKRAAAADKRRLDVERKRKEKEDQLRKEKEEQERQEQLKCSSFYSLNFPTKKIPQ